MSTPDRLLDANKARLVTVLTSFATIQRRRSASVHQLMEAMADVVAQIDPMGLRDSRSHWELSQTELRRGGDELDKLRWASDQMAVLGIQVGHLRVAGDPASRALKRLTHLLQREEMPLAKLENFARILPARHPAIDAAPLRGAVARLRREHNEAQGVLSILSDDDKGMSTAS